MKKVLNLVINGMPSIRYTKKSQHQENNCRFKPCYKWNAFNTFMMHYSTKNSHCVLNLVINGMPSIL